MLVHYYSTFYDSILSSVKPPRLLYIHTEQYLFPVSSVLGMGGIPNLRAPHKEIKSNYCNCCQGGL